MSDLEKVLSYARNHCINEVMELRWEGAGDCEHPATIIEGLKNETYDGSTNRIKFNATCNLYESEDSEIYETALNRLNQALVDTTDDQTCTICAGVDCTRASRSIDQSKAHIMFVRNIMLTNEHGQSLTSETEPLKQLHVKTIRQRSNSIVTGGKLSLGMSGQPGLRLPIARRDNAKVQNLFFGSNALFGTASRSGLQSPNRNSKGKDDSDSSVEVMKNDGRSLGYKTTYYLTFSK